MKPEEITDKETSFKESVKRARAILREIEARNKQLEQEPPKKQKEIEQTRLI